MLLDVCEKLLNDIILQASENTSLRHQTAGIKSSVEQVRVDMYMISKNLLFRSTISLSTNDHCSQDN